MKRVPILRRSLAAGMRQDVDERVLLERRVLRLELADARHAVLLEERQSVIPGTAREARRACLRQPYTS